MKLIIGSDHRGFKLKKLLIDYLVSKKHNLKDIGTFTQDSCNYPEYCYQVGKAVADRKAEKGIFICKTGIGSAIALNKISGVRAALVYELKGAKYSRLHNDSNVLVLGSDFVDSEKNKKIVNIWLKTSFEAGRHSCRINQIKKIKKNIKP